MKKLNESISIILKEKEGLKELEEGVRVAVEGRFSLIQTE